jgi:hypothetical protein
MAAARPSNPSRALVQLLTDRNKRWEVKPIQTLLSAKADPSMTLVGLLAKRRCTTNPDYVARLLDMRADPNGRVYWTRGGVETGDSSPLLQLAIDSTHMLERHPNRYRQSDSIVQRLLSCKASLFDCASDGVPSILKLIHSNFIAGSTVVKICRDWSEQYDKVAHTTARMALAGGSFSRTQPMFGGDMPEAFRRMIAAQEALMAEERAAHQESAALGGAGICACPDPKNCEHTHMLLGAAAGGGRARGHDRGNMWSRLPLGIVDAIGDFGENDPFNLVLKTPSKIYQTTTVFVAMCMRFGEGFGGYSDSLAQKVEAVRFMIDHGADPFWPLCDDLALSFVGSSTFKYETSQPEFYLGTPVVDIVADEAEAIAQLPGKEFLRPAFNRHFYPRHLPIATDLTSEERLAQRRDYLESAGWINIWECPGPTITTYYCNLAAQAAPVGGDRKRIRKS